MYEEINIRDVKITGGILAEKRTVITEKTVPYIRKALNDEIKGIEKSGAFENFRIAAGESNSEFYGLVSQDSDVFKWMEAAALSLQFENEMLDTKEKIHNKNKEGLEAAVKLLEKAQQKSGYLNSYYIINGLKNQWHYLKESCQLYCAGHLIEAAVSYYETTRAEELLEIAMRYANYICRCFGKGKDQIRGYDGHAEIELALYRLYQVTGDEKYRKQADFFVEERGRKPYFFSEEKKNQNVTDYLVYELDEVDYRHSQSHMPIREQKEAVGHAVKALYFYTAAAYKADFDNDEELYCVLKKLWGNITEEKMYLTGAVGSSEYGESFTYSYDLPSDLMYGETCASIALFLFAFRMLCLKNDSVYADVMEKTLYNSILVGISEQGTEFFYTNALEIIPERCEQRKDYSHLKSKRQPWFECPCCPSNLARLILSLNKYIYTVDDRNLNIHLFVQSTGYINGWEVIQETDYPREGTIKITVKKQREEEGKIKIRVPSWCANIVFYENGKEIIPDIIDGYAEFPQKRGKIEANILIDMEMKPYRVYADLRVKSLIGKTAVMRGPIVYCAEEVDNGDVSSLYISQMGEMKGDFKSIRVEGWKCKGKSSGLYSMEAPKYEKKEIIYSPYYQWGNRGQGEMSVFLKER